MQTKILQIEPSRCTAKLEAMPKVTLAEPKLDGHRALLHLGEGLDRVYMTSRRISKKTGEFAENGLCVPQIIGENIGADYTVLDGEVIVPDHPFESVQSVLGAYPDVAIAWQEANTKAVFYAFDVLFFLGADVRNKALQVRKQVLRDALHMIKNDNIKCVPYTEGTDHSELYAAVVSNGGEGLVLKNQLSAYGIGWAKWKKQETFDVVIMGGTSGTKKYREMVGAVEFGAYKDGTLTKIGRCSGMTDGDCSWIGPNGGFVKPNSKDCILRPNAIDQPEGSRAWFTLHMDELRGKVMEVECNGVTALGHLRHPRFLRMRHDKPAEQCLAP